ncbi:response regulator transcription factor [candidate division KSB1 bacterium]|nr:response regulator transcription factor [candidate division KSB1 bacterium]RQW08180.1 MAG: DNA-binding response regulator [candidate division KSB1 bacterium]
MAKKILLVDDEKDILELLEFNLEAEGYKTYKARDGEEALKKAVEKLPDLILLDIMLPKKDGLTVLRELRANRTTADIPVIFLTAKDSEIDEIVGLELGADDYIIKPISIRKLLARVKKSFRKTHQQMIDTSESLAFGALIIDPASYQVVVDGKEVTLTKKEFEILHFLARRPGRVITRSILLDELWDDNVVVIDRTVDVHIRKIREKLGVYMDLIETVKGIGYRFRSE